MNISEKNIDLFDHFLKGDLPAEEALDFKLKLANDPLFLKEFDSYTESIKTIKTFAIGQEMAQLIDKEEKKNRILWVASIAAFITLILTLPILYNLYSENSASKNIFLTYYSPYPAEPNFRGENQEYHLVMNLYRNKNYKEALPLFEKLLIEESSSTDWAYLYLGNCYLMENETLLAIEAFRRASRSTSIVIAQNAEWYLALSYLKAGNNPQAEASLKQLANSKHLFREKANQVLSDLN